MKDNTVKCPSCKEVFKVDDAVYNNIVNQVRDQQFKDELNTRIAAEKRDKEAALKTTELELNNKFQRELGNKQRELDVLRAKSKSDLIEEVSKKDARILTLESKINQGETDKKLALSDAIKTIEKERDQLLNNLRAKDTEMELKEKSLKEEFRREIDHVAKDIKLKEDEIERLKDFKQKLSTKMVGETLELHCETEFNKIRATGFQNAEFEKDNDASGGTKGDYVFREKDENDHEIISIMFEMKNESDTTATKSKNEDFFNVSKYAEICFVSRSIVKDGANYKAIGSLTILGVSKEVSIPFSLSQKENKTILTGTLEINRFDFGLAAESYTTSIMVDDKAEVEIICVLKN